MTTAQAASSARAGGGAEDTARPVRVLFMQSQTYFGADSQIHAALMRGLDPAEVRVHAACNTGHDGDSPSFRALSQIPGLVVRPQTFGPGLDGRSKRQLGLELLHTGLRGALDLAGLWRFARRERIQIVHCTEKPRDAFYGLLLARAAGARCVIHLHVKAEGWLSPLVRWAMRRADRLIAISGYVAWSMREMGFPAERISVVPNALDAGRWDPDTPGGGLRAELGLPDGVPVVAIVARVFYWKGHLALLEALARIADEQDFRLLVVGEDDPRGAPGRPGLTADLRDRAQSLGIADRVLFTGPRRDVERILAACDVFAMPSHEEPFGMVYLEAMAMARPVVALRSGGVPEIVADGKTGLLAEDGDIPELASCLRRLLADPELRRRLGAAGLERVRRDFTPQRMARQMAQIYQELVP
ncbi:MAG: glycosyltransferase family 4 protein [Candidatus Dormibacteraeota bacterium]|nr:glycosyltransferase family 4 protein [Candidatus Dormibacteraeota bacterium]MBO0744762.1 glycosyltransferase family 4 protein [Candidatus Dormibacteraeota bacterium]